MESANQNSSTSNDRPKQKIFQTIQKNLATLGMGPDFAMQSYPFNWRILMGFFVMGSFIICCFEFTLYEAETFAEFAQSICGGSSASFIIFEMFFIVLTLNRLLQFMNDCESLVNTRKYPISNING